VGIHKPCKITRNNELVGGFNPSEKYESQLGLLIGMFIPNIWKNKSHVPNHQPVYYSKKELWDVVGILGPWHGHHY